MRVMYMHTVIIAVICWLPIYFYLVDEQLGMLL